MADFILDPGENVVERIDRYWIDLMPVTVSAALIVLVVLTGTYAYFRFRELTPAFITPEIIFALGLLLLIIVALMLMSAVYVYTRNYLIVTNKHLIKVQQHGLFSRQTSELRFGNVEDVRGGRHGVLGTLLDYGDIEVQTAGTSENFLFRTVHHPQLLADRLLEYQEHFKHPVLTPSPPPLPTIPPPTP